jgi:hypothetical protein
MLRIIYDDRVGHFPCEAWANGLAAAASENHVAYYHFRLLHRDDVCAAEDD